jgi:four helix bundle suffix protein
LLSWQIKRLEEDFVIEGGLREKMTRARINHRKKGQ